MEQFTRNCFAGLLNMTSTPPTPPSKRIAAFSTPTMSTVDLTETLSTIEFTPKRSKKKCNLRKKLQFSKSPRVQVMPAWKENEFKHLVQYLMLYTDGKSWISDYSNNAFWTNAGKFIQSQVHSFYCRSG